MRCFDVNAPVTGALRVAFTALLVLLVAAVALHRRRRPTPRIVLRAYVVVSSLAAFVVMMFATDVGATDHQLWAGVVAPVGLAVFSLYAELWRSETTTSSVPTAISPRYTYRKNASPFIRRLKYRPRNSAGITTGSAIAK
jgi:hypothetical protein